MATQIGHKNSKSVWSQRFVRRRRALGISVRQLAERANVSMATVNRVLAGNNQVSIGHVLAIAEALGLAVQLRSQRGIKNMVYRQAITLSKRVVALTQATAGLEGQAVSKEEARVVRRQVASRLLKSRRQLWSQ